MWNTVAWRGLSDSEIADAIGELRDDALRALLLFVTVSYFGWQFVSTITAPVPDAPRSWIVAPVVVLSLLGTYVLHSARSALAAPYFLLTSVLAIVAAIWLLAVPFAAVLLPVTVLAAVVLLHPLAGVIVSVGWLGVVLGLRQATSLPLLSDALLVWVGVASLTTVVAAWTLGRSLVVAVEWSLHSYVQAMNNAETAQAQRAQLVQALKQLDIAYYRLQQSNAALEMAWKAAEAAERSRTEFVTSISHELRTPLNLIVGFSEMILNSPESYGVLLPTVYRVDLNAIHRNAQHLLSLTDDVIDLARVGMDRLALAREPVDLGEVIRDACQIVDEYVALKGLWLQAEVQPDLPMLSLDRLRIRQVLLNLLTNAVRFTDQGGITVAARSEGEWVTVKVVDTGRGISPEALSRVFDEFYFGGEGSARRSGELGGIGLGLPISKRFVELHGGQIGVESTLGLGTTFWLRLPLVTVDGAVQGMPWHPTSLTGPSARAERCLVLVGDDTQVCDLFRRHLRGYQTISVSSLRRAIETAAELHAVGIVADLEEPNADGHPSSIVPILRVPLPSGERVALTLGATGFLTKPVASETLDAALAGLPNQPRRVLVVDDDPQFVHLMTRMLTARPERRDVEVLAAQGGRAALEMMDRARPDLVLLDLMMPDLGGREVLAAMRANPSLSDVPAIVVSAQDLLLEATPLLTGELRLTKPDGFQFESLLESIEALFAALRQVPWAR